MYKFLVKYIIKDHTESIDVALRSSYGNLSSVVGMIVNLLLFASKLIVGTLVGSIALVGDAVNNLSDAGSSIVTFISFRVAKKPADKDHPFGHARIEYLASCAVAGIIIFIGIDLLKNSFIKILDPEKVTFRWFTVVLLVLSILCKFWLYRFNLKIAARIRSSVIKATALDSLSDVLATSAVLISAILSPIMGIELDGFMGFLVSIFILVSGFKTLKSTIDQILGQSPSPEVASGLEKAISSYEGVLGMHDLVVHDYGPARCFASVHVEVDANSNVLDSHELIDKIERDILQTQGIHLVIHLDPIVLDDPWMNTKQDLILEILQGIDPSLSIHDFRGVRGKKQSNLIFDVVIAHENPLPDQALVEKLQEQVKQKDSNLQLIITVDRV